MVLRMQYIVILFIKTLNQIIVKGAFWQNTHWANFVHQQCLLFIFNS